MTRRGESGQTGGPGDLRLDLIVNRVDDGNRHNTSAANTSATQLLLR